MNDLGDLGSDLLGKAGDGVVTLEEVTKDGEIAEALVTLEKATKDGEIAEASVTLGDVDIGADTNVEELTLLLTTGELLESLLDTLELYNTLC